MWVTGPLSWSQGTMVAGPLPMESGRAQPEEAHHLQVGCRVYWVVPKVVV